MSGAYTDADDALTQLKWVAANNCRECTLHLDQDGARDLMAEIMALSPHAQEVERLRAENAALAEEMVLVGVARDTAEAERDEARSERDEWRGEGERQRALASHRRNRDTDLAMRAEAAEAALASARERADQLTADLNEVSRGMKEARIELQEGDTLGAAIARDAASAREEIGRLKERLRNSIPIAGGAGAHPSRVVSFSAGYPTEQPNLTPEAEGQEEGRG